jgi:GABA(A) receptor-associated protein
VPNDLTAYHFNYIIRKRIKLPEKDSLYFFVNGKYLLKGGKSTYPFLNHLDTLMAQVYEKKKDSDGFLYITYTDETTLGEFEAIE